MVLLENLSGTSHVEATTRRSSPRLRAYSREGPPREGLARADSPADSPAHTQGRKTTEVERHHGRAPCVRPRSDDLAQLNRERCGARPRRGDRGPPRARLQAGAPLPRTTPPFAYDSACRVYRYTSRGRNRVNGLRPRRNRARADCVSRGSETCRCTDRRRREIPHCGQDGVICPSAIRAQSPYLTRKSALIPLMGDIRDSWNSLCSESH